MTFTAIASEAPPPSFVRGGMVASCPILALKVVNFEKPVGGCGASRAEFSSGRFPLINGWSSAPEISRGPKHRFFKVPGDRHHRLIDPLGDAQIKRDAAEHVGVGVTEAGPS